MDISFLDFSEMARVMPNVLQLKLHLTRQAHLELEEIWEIGLMDAPLGKYPLFSHQTKCKRHNITILFKYISFKIFSVSNFLKQIQNYNDVSQHLSAFIQL